MTTRQLDPRLKGYRQWEDFDPFEDRTGPFYFREDDGGQFRCALITSDKQMNCTGAMHGGALMSFADNAMFTISRNSLKGIRAVTVSFHADFVAAAGPGEFIEATGEVVKETGSLIFVRGKVFRGETTLVSFSGVLKKIGTRGEGGTAVADQRQREN